jgi:predicted dehydrogenase
MPAKKRNNGSASTRQVRYAVVGLGHIAQAAVLPAFAHARKNSVLTALVSDDPAKMRSLARKYGVARELCCGYESYDELLAGGEIDAVYIALPNHMHCDYALRAAQAGIHVLCEKPMAVTSAECEQMIEAADAGGIKLMIAYRLHFEQTNLKAVELANSGRLGDLRFFTSDFSMQVKDGDIRLQQAAGGGTLYDIGIYCINAARYLFRDEPIAVMAVSANSGDERFREVDETTSVVLAFSDGRLASFTSSFGSADTSRYRLVGTKGDVAIESAYDYAKTMKQTVTIKGKSTTKSFAKRDQFAPELLHFSTCILSDEPPRPSGEEGLADVRIIEALYESAETGRLVELGGLKDPPARPVPEQEIRRPAVRKPTIVRATSPRQKVS